jgi:hypothetical protein
MWGARFFGAASGGAAIVRQLVVTPRPRQGEGWPGAERAGIGDAFQGGDPWRRHGKGRGPS